MEQAGTRKTRWATLLLFLAALLGVIIGPAAYLLTADFPHVLFTYQEAVDGVKDCTNYALADNSWERLNGEWSFYYDRWIVSDQDSAPRDGVIDPMSSWAGFRLEDGRVLPREGYASYQLVVKGAPAGLPLVFDYLAMDGAYNLYLDGTLVFASGIPAKEAGDNQKASFVTYQKSVEVPSNGEFSLVCELGMNDHGGAFSPPCIVAHYQPGTVEDFLTKLLPFISGTLIFALAASALTLFLSQGKKRRDWTLVATLFALAFYFFFSLDMLNAFRYFRVPTIWRLFQACTILGQAWLSLLLVLGIKRRKEGTFGSEKKDHVAFALFFSLTVGLAFGAYFSYGYAFERFFFYGLTALLLVPLFFVVAAAARKKKGAMLDVWILALLMDIFLSEGLPYSAYRTTVTYLISSFFCLFIAVLFFLVFWRESAAIRADEEEKERLKEAFLSARQEALRSQIKPHFIFNCLTAIEDSYHCDRKAGDKAIAMFAKHLRTDVDTLDVDQVPFAAELDSILNYANLENLRLEQKFLLLFDIQYQDFLIPPLSLQPFVENAIKYAKTNEKEDGFIQIRSELREDGFVEVDVEDNGIGFDVDHIKATSQGLKNARERLRLLLGASLTLVSTPGRGTLCQILFKPKSLPSAPAISARKAGE
jgi:signal transduction histidine kinase